MRENTLDSRLGKEKTESSQIFEARKEVERGEGASGVGREGQRNIWM